MDFLGRTTDSETCFSECKLKLAGTTEFHVEWNKYIKVEQPSTRVSLHCYHKAVPFMVNETKSPCKAVPFYVCSILLCTIY